MLRLLAVRLFLFSANAVTALEYGVFMSSTPAPAISFFAFSSVSAIERFSFLPIIDALSLLARALGTARPAETFIRRISISLWVVVWDGSTELRYQSIPG